MQSKFESLNDMDTGINEETENHTLDIPSRESSVMQELDLYMVNQDKSLFSLKKYPRIKELYLRYNTSIPSSAPVERLFSTEGLRRNRLTDELFETLLI